MSDSHFINRLCAWIEDHEASGTARDFIEADLQSLGPRLDAALDAGNKGAHAPVSQFEASRFVTGTYLLLGDVLELMPE